MHFLGFEKGGYEFWGGGEEDIYMLGLLVYLMKSLYSFPT